MKSIKYVECVIQSMSHLYACHQPQLLSNEHRH